MVYAFKHYTIFIAMTTADFVKFSVLLNYICDFSLTCSINTTGYSFDSNS